MRSLAYIRYFFCTLTHIIFYYIYYIMICRSVLIIVIIIYKLTTSQISIRTRMEIICQAFKCEVSSETGQNKLLQQTVDSEGIQVEASCQHVPETNELPIFQEIQMEVNNQDPTITTMEIEYDV